jgi:hypothetical protein
MIVWLGIFKTSEYAEFSGSGGVIGSEHVGCGHFYESWF